jgi:hypothetical protein
LDGKLDGKKIIPKDISKYLTNVSLAYWILNNGWRRFYR